MALFDDTGAARFDGFDVHRTSYKKIGDHEIEVGILIPKTLKPGKHPLLVKFHGGGLVTGDCLYPDWFAAWFIPFCQRNNAVIVSANYRLVPEHNGNDILEDLADFWTWFNKGGVARYLASQNLSIELDSDRLLVSGESAGGWVALQSGLVVPKGVIKAILVQYPMTNYLHREPVEEYFGKPTPPSTLIDEHVSTIKPGTIVSSVTPPERVELAYALSAYDRHSEFFGTGKHLWPITAIEDAKNFPPTLIIHGEQDRAVSIEDSRAFVRRAGEVVKGVEIRLSVREGDHAFDLQMKEDEMEWLREELKWIEGKWLT